MDRHPKEPEQALTNELDTLLCEALHKADGIAFYAHITGLHTAGAGWEMLRDEIRALMVRARKMPR